MNRFWQCCPRVNHKFGKYFLAWLFLVISKSSIWKNKAGITRIKYHYILSFIADTYSREESGSKIYPCGTPNLTIDGQKNFVPTFASPFLFISLSTNLPLTEVVWNAFSREFNCFFHLSRFCYWELQFGI